MYKIRVFAECLADENTYFIVSPKDIVEARQRDEDDHISWLIERQMFEVGALFLPTTVQKIYVTCLLECRLRLQFFSKEIVHRY